jgi:hypothetical protein
LNKLDQRPTRNRLATYTFYCSSFWGCQMASIHS